MRRCQKKTLNFRKGLFHCRMGATSRKWEDKVFQLLMHIPVRPAYEMFQPAVMSAGTSRVQIISGQYHAIYLLEYDEEHSICWTKGRSMWSSIPMFSNLMWDLIEISEFDYASALHLCLVLSPSLCFSVASFLSCSLFVFICFLFRFDTLIKRSSLFHHCRMALVSLGIKKLPEWYTVFSVYCGGSALRLLIPNCSPPSRTISVLLWISFV